MKTNRRALHEALRELVRIQDRKPTLDVLNTVKIEATQGNVTLTTSNLDQWLSAEIPGEGELAVCIPAKVLQGLTKPENKADDGEVVIEVLDEETVTIVVDGLKTQLKTEPVEDFPLPSTEDFDLVAMWPAKPFMESLAFVAPVASDDFSRPHLASVCLGEKDNGQRVCACDGHRLHTAPSPSILPEPILLPIKAATALQRILKGAQDVIIARSDDRVKMKAGQFTLESKVVDAVFPPVDQVIPSRTETQLVVDAKMLTKAVKKMRALSKNPGIKMTVNGVIEMTSANPSVGEATMIVEPVSSNHPSDAPDIELGFNSAYLLDSMAKEKGEVRIGLSGPLDPVRFDYEDGRIGVVMPMRV